MPLNPDRAAKKAATSHPLATDMSVTAPAPQVLAVPPEARFIYRYSPDSWELVQVDGKPALIPVFSKILLVPGVNGIPMVRAGGGMLEARSIEQIEAEAITKAQLKGWGIIPLGLTVPAEYLPPGVSPGLLRRVVMTVSGEERWHDCFETHQPQAIGGVKVVYHRAHFHRWMAGMVEAGNFGEPPAHVVPSLRTQVETMRRERETRLSSVSPEIRASRLAPLDAELEALSKLEAADA